MSRDDFQSFIEEIMTISQIAPSRSSLDRTLLKLINDQAAYIEFFKARRFEISSDLKLTATGTPNQIHLSPGIFQINSRWYRAVSTNLSVASSAVSIIFADTSVITDSITAQIKSSTDLSLRKGIRADLKTGTALFRKGSTRVVGQATLFRTELEPTSQIRPQVVSVSDPKRYYTVSSITSDTELTLADPFLGHDTSIAYQLAQHLFLFGEVTTTGTTVTAIQAPGILGIDTFLDTEDSNGHGVHMKVPGIFVNVPSPQSILIRRLLGGLKAAHKLMFISGDTEFPSGKVLGEGLEKYAPSDASLIEDFESSTWPRY